MAGARLRCTQRRWPVRVYTTALTRKGSGSLGVLFHMQCTAPPCPAAAADCGRHILLLRRSGCGLCGAAERAAAQASWRGASCSSGRRDSVCRERRWPLPARASPPACRLACVAPPRGGFDGRVRRAETRLPPCWNWHLCTRPPLSHLHLSHVSPLPGGGVASQLDLDWRPELEQLEKIAAVLSGVALSVAVLSYRCALLLKTW